jgi:hypothetical protein
MKVEGKKAEDVPTGAVSGKGEKILIIEDDPVSFPLSPPP